MGHFLQAGYVIESLTGTSINDNQALSLAGNLCRFSVDTDISLDPPFNVETGQSPLAVLHNMIIRGAPTRGSLWMDEAFVRKYNILEKSIDERQGSLHFSPGESGDNDFSDKYRRAFSAILPEKVLDKNYLKKHQNNLCDSNAEQQFMDYLEARFGAWISQHLIQQLPVEAIITRSPLVDQKFLGQRFDFVIPFPWEIDNIRGLIIEVDGPEHENPEIRHLDKMRDDATLQHGWRTIRIPVIDLDRLGTGNSWDEIARYLDDEIFDDYRLNYEKSLFDDEAGRSALIHALSPLAIARIQLVMVRYLLANPEITGRQTLHIAVAERDVPAGEVAIQDLNIWFEKLQMLTGMEHIAPSLKFEIFRDKNFGSVQDSNPIENLKPKDFDIVLDVSTMSMCGVQPVIKNISNAIIIRNAPVGDIKRIFITGDHIVYPAFGRFENQEFQEKDKDRINALVYVLQSVFRKVNYRRGQMPILNKALQAESVIGLLPTGGGKSLTYQLAALLQPGVCMIVDPIISLMQDQYDNLVKNFIDGITFINSSVSRQEKSQRVASVGEGKTLFFFISPERLLIEDFRKTILHMAEDLTNPVFFSYCVIDEAHCVSEWGHDFRTSYLSLGENAMKFCKTRNRRNIPLFGLTATASYDVLSDIQRELSGNNPENRLPEDALVQFESQKREELQFEIVPVQTKALSLGNDFEMKKEVAYQKRGHLSDIISSQKENLKKGAGLIFCPHRSWVFGVTDRFKQDNKREPDGTLEYLSREFPELNDTMGFYMGSDSEDQEISKAVRDASMKNQYRFINGESNLLVATKAFGMGIDKPDIRFTVHLNYPGSIEGYVQEAGRAGRDGDNATAYILYHEIPDETLTDPDYAINDFFHNRSFRGPEKEKTVAHELLNEIYFPSRVYDITADLQNNFDTDCYVSIWSSRAGRHYVSIQETFQNKIGNIGVWRDLPVYFGDDIKNGNADHTIEEAEEMLAFIRNKLLTKGNSPDIWKWLNEPAEIKPGILTLLESLKNGETQEVILPWENNVQNRVENIHNLIEQYHEEGNIHISKIKQLVSGNKSAHNFHDFVEKLSSGNQFDLESIALNRDERQGKKPGTTLKNLEKYYNGVRDKKDTEKAIYRLRLLGVIDDYLVDYRSGAYRLFIHKANNDYYKEKLRYYISKFFSDERTESELSKAERLNGKHFIERCMSFLVDFAYEQIAEKRKRSIGDMQDACKYGLERGAEELKDYIDLYFNSKYARDVYEVDGENWSLKYKTKIGKQSDMDLVWDYISLIDRDGDSEINNLKHLRGASLRMLRAAPDNVVLLILSSYATFILEYRNELLLPEAIDNLEQAMDLLEADGLSEEELKNVFDDLVDEIIRRRPEIEDYYEFEFENFRLKYYLRMLKDSNQAVTDLTKHLTT